MTSVEFQVKKKQLPEYRIVERTLPATGDGEIRLKIEQFSFTANNVTYGVAGDLLRYWQFFPATDNADDVWGIIPVWAFADVVESNHSEVPVGDRLYGYFPPATDLVIQPGDITKSSLTDKSAHRQALPPLYNRYRRVLADAAYSKDQDVARALLGPLHITSFCLWDHLKQSGCFEAEQVVVVSASSKTALGLAYGLSKDKAGATVVGLTGTQNEAFVRGVNLYDEVVTYDKLTESLAQKPTVVVDMAGNAAVKAELATHLGEQLRHYIGVGITHWEDLGDRSATGKLQFSHENFFAPSYILERIKAIGPAEFDTMSTQFAAGAAAATFQWMSVDTRSGLSGLAEVYAAICAGDLSPATGVMVAMP